MKQAKCKTPNFPLPKARKDSDKLSPSTASPHSPANISTNPFKSCEEQWTADCSQDPERLVLSLCAIEGSQEEMKARFDRMVEFLSAQIARNSEENRRLGEEVVQLGREVRECGEDIKAIEGMLRGGRAERGRESGVMEETSIDRNQSRISSSSASRKLLLSSHSN
jgi:hypothetical protein